MAVSKKRKIEKIEMTPHQIKTMHEKSIADANTALVKVVDLWTNMLLVALRDEFGFGKERMKRLGDKFGGMLEALEKCEISDEDIDQTLVDEVGLSARSLIKIKRSSHENSTGKSN